MNLFGLAAVIVTGFVAGAELGSWALVQPVLRRLPAREYIDVEQGLLTTFGRVMPAGMILCVALTVAVVVAAPADPVSWAAAVSVAIAVATTVVVNVPINLATGRWDPEHPPADWRAVRRRWSRFQGLRSWLLALGFVLTAVSAA